MGAFLRQFGVMLMVSLGAATLCLGCGDDEAAGGADSADSAGVEDTADEDTAPADTASPPDTAPADTGSHELVDIDGNVYATVTIGEQVWMAEMFRATTFNDGVAIAEWEFGDDWFAGGATPLYQWADASDLNGLYDEELPEDFYGALYNEGALASGRLAPEGWRIPTEQDFLDLEAFVASDGHAGREAEALKSTSGWTPDSYNGSDAYGFNALPNGYVAAGGTATGAQVIAGLATSTVDADAKTRLIINLMFDEPTMFYGQNSILLGAGVRLIKE